MKTIQLTILRSTIFDAVKSETMLSSNADRAVDEKATRLAYHEAAADDEYVMRKLERTLVTAAEEIKTFMSDYAVQNQQSVADNAVFLDLSDSSSVKFRMLVSDRFNDAFVDSLARLVSDYITQKMLMLWWMPINQNRSNAYFSLADKILPSVMRCFNRTPPVAPAYPYPTEFGKMQQVVSLQKGMTGKIAYSLKGDVIDDIDVSSLNLNVVKAMKTEDGVISVFGVNTGTATIQLFSRHDTSVSAMVIVKVYEDD